MKIIGAGLSKTGTTSLSEALTALGFTCLHYDQERLNDVLEGAASDPDFRRYDDVDAVTDIPTAYFYRELLEAYPDSKVILTVRDVDEWWSSIRIHFNERFPIVPPTLRDQLRSWLRRTDETERWRQNMRFRTNLRSCVYGSADAREYLYKKRYVDHNRAVRRDVPGERLLVMDIAAGDGWSQLCGFLGVPEPDIPFPHRNRR
jgi:hypothetical protein